LQELIRKEELLINLERKTRKAEKGVKFIIHKMEANNNTIPQGSKFWIYKELETMNCYKPDTNIVDKLKLWENYIK